MIVVFLILMLKKLTQMAELFRAWSTVVREFRHALTITVTTISQLWHHEWIHFMLLLCKLVDLRTSIVGSEATSTIATLHMLGGISTRAKASITTNRTRNAAWTMDLHMHVELVLMVEHTSTLATFIDSRCTDAIHATRISATFHPLIVAIVATSIETTTICTGTSDAVHAPRISVTFPPLVVGKVLAIAEIATIRAVSSHFRRSLRCEFLLFSCANLMETYKIK